MVGDGVRLSAGKDVWSIRGLLDFNLLFGEWPDALPRKANTFQPSPGYDAYAQLKEGYPWFHKEDANNATIMVLVERLKECPDTPELRVHKYSARAFHGFRGEFPFQELSEKHDYTGYEDFECMDLVIRTGVGEQVTGKVSVTAAESVAVEAVLPDMNDVRVLPASNFKFSHIDIYV